MIQHSGRFQNLWSSSHFGFEQWNRFIIKTKNRLLCQFTFFKKLWMGRSCGTVACQPSPYIARPPNTRIEDWWVTKFLLLHIFVAPNSINKNTASDIENLIANVNGNKIISPYTNGILKSALSSRRNSNQLPRSIALLKLLMRSNIERDYLFLRRRSTAPRRCISPWNPLISAPFLSRFDIVDFDGKCPRLENGGTLAFALPVIKAVTSAPCSPGRRASLFCNRLLLRFIDIHWTQSIRHLHADRAKSG